MKERNLSTGDEIMVADMIVNSFLFAIWEGVGVGGG